MTSAADGGLPAETSDGNAEEGPLYLDPARLLEGASRLSDLLPLRNSDRFEQWLCVRYLETAEANWVVPTRPELPDRITLKISSCVEFADDFFGMPYDETYRYFNVFKANNKHANRRWPKSVGTNKWPVQSFWQRFSELSESRPQAILYNFSTTKDGLSIGTKRNEEGVTAFRSVILWAKKEQVLLNIIDLADWALRQDQWSGPPSDREVVARFLKKIWIEPAEDVWFDPQSRELLAQARAEI